MAQSEGKSQPAWAAAAVALTLGLVVRAWLLAERPLWLDEIFTLWVARQPFTSFAAVLGYDTGPPLHYALVRMLLLGAGGHVPEAALVRVPALVAWALHLPLLAAVARHAGQAPAIPWILVLAAVSPLGIRFSVEGRGYALVSLLVLAAVERTLALRARAGWGPAVGLGLAAWAAVMTMYIAVFPLACLPLLLVRHRSRPVVTRFLAATVGAVVLVAPWVPVALRQPIGGEAWPWVGLVPAREAAGRTVAGLAFGADPTANLAVWAVAAVAVLAAGLLRGGAPDLRALAAGSIALLAGTAALRGTLALLPARTIVPLLPLVQATLGAAPRGVVVATLAGSVVALPAAVDGLVQPNPHQALAAHLEPLARQGHRFCVVGVHAVEVDHFLRHQGQAGQVVYFPRGVALHPGWHDDARPGTPELRAEAAALLREPARPTVYLLPHGARASAALLEAFPPGGARLIVSTPYLGVYALPPEPVSVYSPP